MGLDINIEFNVRSPRVEQQLGEIMATLQETLDKVREQSTQLASLNAFVEGLFEQLKALPLSPENQAKIDEIFAEVKANDQRIADAMTEGTPQA